MKRRPATNFMIAVACVAVAILACESPVGEDPKPPPPGQFFFGDEATAEVKRLLEREVQAREVLKGPHGARLAASWGLPLDEAIAAASESIEHFTDILDTFSGKAYITLLEGEVRAAQATLEALKGPQGTRRAAELGMTLTAAIADVEEKIGAYGRALAIRRQLLAASQHE